MGTVGQETNKLLSSYYTGYSTTIACQADQRFSYCTYTPKSWSYETAANYSLLVAVHGSDRAVHATREQFVSIAEATNTIILSPLFPAGVSSPTDTDNYKYIAFNGIRFDSLLLEMITEVRKRYGLATQPFSLFGFSGGAHFAHRFFYLHPEKINALSIAAPGSVTLLDDNKNWWTGTKDFEEIFGSTLNMPAMQNTKVHLVVGAQDTETGSITHTPDSPHWVPGANNAGLTRVERLQALHQNWDAHQIPVQIEVIEGIQHKLEPLAASAAAFFAHA